MTARCSECRHSVTYTHDGLCPFYLSHVCKDNEHFEGRTTTPISTDDCECRYPHVDDIPEGTCERCGLNTIGGSCGHRPKKEDIIPVTGSRFYTPIVEEGMHETEPIVFDVEG